MPRSPLRDLAAVAALAAAACGSRGCGGGAVPVPAPPAAGPGVEPDDCVECHRKEVDLWRTSWHSTSVRPATKSNVSMPVPGVADLGPGVHRHEVSEKDGKLFMTAAEADGTVRPQPVDYVIGGGELEMYVTLHGPDRRPQVLPAMFFRHPPHFVPYEIIYSAREMETLTPSLVEPGDPIYFWTELPRTFVGAQTLCYRCHSILTKRTYDPDTGVYAVDWGTRGQTGVPCAACHGDAAAHVAAARRGVPEPPPPTQDPDPRPGDRDSSNEACARCHIQGDSISLDFVPGGNFHDQWLMTVLDERPFFHPDGRWRETGSSYTDNAHQLSECFRMGGMTCRSCHDVHGDGGRAGSVRLTLAACDRCHVTQGRACREHPRAPAAAAPAAKFPNCLSCHMPEMPKERRHGHVADHRVSVPDAALTRLLSIPNACADCHADQDTAWTESALAAYGARERSSRRRAVTIALALAGSDEERARIAASTGRAGDAAAVAAGLRGLLAEREAPWPQAAAAARLLGAFPSRETLGSLAAAVRGAAHPGVRAAAAFGLFGGFVPPNPGVPPEDRDTAFAALRRAARDRSRVVRVMASAALALFGRREDQRAALPIIEDVSRAIPDNFSMREVLASAYEQLGEWDKAGREHDRMCRIRPRDPAPRRAKDAFERRMAERPR